MKPHKYKRTVMAESVGYAEVNLSANHLRNLIRALLKTFTIPEADITIYLRQDRDAIE